MFISDFLNESRRIMDLLDVASIEIMANILAASRDEGGRLFILGVGGSAGSASHAVNDFRKLTGFEAYSPMDNVSELTARTNDEGWRSVMSAWLAVSRLSEKDCLLILSVGGGDAERDVSVNIVEAVKLAKTRGAKVVGIVGRDGGYTAKHADAVILIPVVNPDHVTPHTESFHSLLCHLLVSHPALKTSPTKWESVTK